MEEVAMVSVSEVASASIGYGGFPPKLRDMGIFTISCTFGDKIFWNPLANLGSSINIMPTRIYHDLNLGPLTPTPMRIELANRSVVEPRGIIENISVKCAHFVYPVDFVVLDTEGYDASIILGRPFLVTTPTIIEVSGSKITLRFGEEEISYKMTPIPNFHKYYKWEDVKMDCKPVTPPTTPPSNPEIEWFNMVFHVDPHDAQVEGESDSCKKMKKPGKEKSSCKMKTQELFKVSHVSGDHGRKLQRFIFQERHPKKGDKFVKGNLSPILENEEFGKCYKPFTDNNISIKEPHPHHLANQFSNGSFLSHAPDEASERLHGLHLGLHHKYDFYKGSSVKNEGLSI
ncbi:unnamed protein product [Linum trigynum]|uniref:Uncharacterized protein n=1 Tax=Linum trigynum TaxID=586398 RepID=A0AAV2CY34_9ROSI